MDENSKNFDVPKTQVSDWKTLKRQIDLIVWVKVTILSEFLKNLGHFCLKTVHKIVLEDLIWA